MHATEIYEKYAVLFHMQIPEKKYITKISNFQTDKRRKIERQTA